MRAPLIVGVLLALTGRAAGAEPPKAWSDEPPKAWAAPYTHPASGKVCRDGNKLCFCIEPGRATPAHDCDCDNCYRHCFPIPAGLVARPEIKPVPAPVLVPTQPACRTEYFLGRDGRLYQQTVCPRK